MKCLKKITLLITILIVDQFSYCGIYQQPFGNASQRSSRNYNTYLYNKNIDHAHHQAADRLTQESYISPEMQWAVLSFSGKQAVTINTITGAAQGIQSVDFMLMAINNKIENNYMSPILYAEKESMKNALHAMLEATDLAIFVATIEAAYRNQQYTFYQNVDAQLSANLKDQKTKIQNILKMVLALQPYDQPASTSSYFSWFGSSNTNSMQYNPYVAPLQFDDNADTVSIPADLMQAIIKKNDYKQEPNAVEAANLLFKECFIAQQHHLKDSLWIHQIRVDLQSPITPENYIFSNFPTIIQMCEIAQNLVSTNSMRTNLQASLTQEQATAHKLLLHIRQAIQTAMYIANAKSSYNVGYILPASVTSYLNGVVSQLLQYDAQLSALCKDAMYGATPEDTYRDAQWANISKIAAGAVITAAVVGTAVALAPVGFTAGAIAQGVSAANTVASVAKNYVPQAWQAADNETTLGTALRYGKVARDISSTAAAAGGAVAFGTQLAQTADTKGWIPLNQIDPNARKIVDTIHDYSTQAAIIGGAGSAIGYAADSLGASGEKFSNITKSNSIGGGIWNVGSALYSTGNVIATGTGAVGSGVAAIGATNSLIGKLTAQNNPQQQQYNPQASTAKFSPQVVADHFANIINSASTKGVDAIAAIANDSIKLLQSDKIAPNTLLQVLHHVRESYAGDATIANGLGQFIQQVTAATNPPETVQ